MISWLKSIFEALKKVFSAVKGLPKFFGWVFGLPVQIVIWGVQAWMAFRAINFGWKLAMISAIAAFVPVPEFVEAIPGLLSGLPASVQYFLYLGQVQFLVSVVVAAWTFRAVTALLYKLVFSS